MNGGLPGHESTAATRDLVRIDQEYEYITSGIDQALAIAVQTVLLIQIIIVTVTIT